MTYSVAVVGATGNVGREIMQMLAERQFPISEIHALASRDSLGKEISFGEDETVPAKNLETFDFSKVDYVFASAGAKISKQYAPKAAAAGAVYIDNSSAFRMDPNVPLVVPEVNAEALHNVRESNIVASPNCVAIPLAMVLRPLHDLATVKRAVVSTYQSTSGAGRDAMDELFSQTRTIFMNNPITKEEFPKQIAFNVIPQIGYFEESGMTGEEDKVIKETQKIVDPSIGISATCVRVPVFVGHAISANIEFDSPIDEKAARDALKEHGVTIIDHRVEDGYITPVEAAGEDGVYVSRVRKDPSVDYGLNLWIVSDNLRKGAALNVVQIAEALIKQ
ncbi:MAG: aspartate-semialdehyde dehydrogenase [Alphaproteobacteria bacterium]